MAPCSAATRAATWASPRACAPEREPQRLRHRGEAAEHGRGDDDEPGVRVAGAQRVEQGAEVLAELGGRTQPQRVVPADEHDGDVGRVVQRLGQMPLVHLGRGDAVLADGAPGDRLGEPPRQLAGHGIRHLLDPGAHGGRVAEHQQPHGAGQVRTAGPRRGRQHARGLPLQRCAPAPARWARGGRRAGGSPPHCAGSGSGATAPAQPTASPSPRSQASSTAQSAQSR